nr:hypothetical protein L203_05018 [Cryptococcus depauperatus CBS 7841]
MLNSKPTILFTYTLALFAASLVNAACTDNNTDTTGLQKLIQGGGAGYKLVLCPGKTYSLNEALNYTAANQEISTEGYPTDDTRATLLVMGFNKTTAVNAANQGQDGAALRHVIVNGNRKSDEAIYTAGGGNIEFGGANANQVIEYVKSFDPRGWSCMHIAEGQLNCKNATIQNNDIGPCGTDFFQMASWADGISLSCSASLVQNNDITDATDGGIVLFGAPGSTVRNNTIRVKTRTMLGGINMVDVLPWNPIGNYSGTVVEGNTIYGGFATNMGNDTRGGQDSKAVIKIGIAVGPDAWFSDERYGTNKSTGAVIKDNKLSGAFVFGMGITSAKDFVIENNSFFGNTSFIGDYGPNCTTGSKTPHPPVPLLAEPVSLINTTLSVPSDSPYNFVDGTAFGLTCFMPPNATINAWPYGGGQINSAQGVNGQDPSGTSTNAAQTSAATATPTKKKSAQGRRAEAPVSRGLATVVMGAAMGFLGGLSLL